MDAQGRKKTTDANSSRARLAQFAGGLDTKVGATVSGSEGADVQNWPHALLFAGSNAFNQLNANYGELMTPNLTYFYHPMFSGVEIMQVSCSGNQTAALVAVEVPVEFTSTKATQEETDRKAYQYQIYMWGTGKSFGQMKVPVSLPPKCTIAQISCGHTHMGFITERGQAFTWGSGDHGMLGHGTKSAVNEPKRLDAFKQLVCTAISCGAFHTAFIATSKEDVSYIRFPQRGEHKNSSLGVGGAGARIISSEECSAGGSLYMCGLGKAGQLGLGADKIPITGGNAGCVARPTMVPFFETEGARVIRVSCGFHHTLAIAVPKQALRVFSPTVYAFGFGEYGRLGLGDEDQVSIPTAVQFPGPFHAIQVSAGEQHSVALGHDGCYAWGSNDMGQLGIGSPAQTEFAATPQRIQLPEGMVARKIVAGGRHTAAVTHCGNVLSWGWGEEGQLGNGTEKSSSLPRPCKLMRVQDRAGVPIDLALGGTHTVVVLHNPSYIAPALPSPVPETAPPEPEPVPEPQRAATPPPPKEPTPPATPVPVILQTSIEAPVIAVMPPVEHKPPMISTEDECGDEDEAPVSVPAPPPPIRGLKDILQQREERKAAAAAREEAERAATPEPAPAPVAEAPTPAPVEVSVSEPAPEPEPEEAEQTEADASAAGVSATASGKEVVEGSALFGNIAKRAEIRKARKASVTGFGTSVKKG